MPVGRGGGGHCEREKNFRPFTTTLLTPQQLPTGVLFSPQFRLHQETKMAARRTQSITTVCQITLAYLLIRDTESYFIQYLFDS